MAQNEPRRFNWIKVLAGVVMAFVGAALFVYGGYDDSPGAQGLGLVITVSGVYSAIKAYRRGRT